MLLQVYFLSGIFLISVGMRLSFEKFGTFFKIDKIFQVSFIENKTLDIILGIGATMIGIVQLIQSPQIEGYVPFLGDFVPAVLGIVGGIAIIVRSTNKNYDGENKYIRNTQSFVNTNIAIIGILMMFMGFIHIIFPDPIFL